MRNKSIKFMEDVEQLILCIIHNHDPVEKLMLTFLMFKNIGSEEVTIEHAQKCATDI